MKIIKKNKENTNEPYILKTVKVKHINFRARSQIIGQNISRSTRMKGIRRNILPNTNTGNQKVASAMKIQKCKISR